MTDKTSDQIADPPTDDVVNVAKAAEEFQRSVDVAYLEKVAEAPFWHRFALLLAEIGDVDKQTAKVSMKSGHAYQHEYVSEGAMTRRLRELMAKYLVVVVVSDTIETRMVEHGEGDSYSISWEYHGEIVLIDAKTNEVMMVVPAIGYSFDSTDKGMNKARTNGVREALAGLLHQGAEKDAGEDHPGERAARSERQKDERPITDAQAKLLWGITRDLSITNDQVSGMLTAATNGRITTYSRDSIKDLRRFEFAVFVDPLARLREEYQNADDETRPEITERVAKTIEQASVATEKAAVEKSERDIAREAAIELMRQLKQAGHAVAKAEPDYQPPKNWGVALSEWYAANHNGDSLESAPVEGWAKTNTHFETVLTDLKGRIRDEDAEQAS